MPKKASHKPTKPTTKKPAIQRNSKRTDKEEYLVMIEWLNIKHNCNSCFQTRKAPAVGYNYKQVNTKSISMGFGLTNEDQKVGISTTNDKIESMCPHYHARNNFMASQAFINPWFKVDAKSDNKTASSTSDNRSKTMRRELNWRIKS
ncbi:hypothetical protein VP01_1612g7 [Puccinia sorghi]|uniref:Uncharacterized protein n=1 Tax=Puccinia sorghi TaxID=27349 RepID=A0A0L6VH78_9BASI|nr:hypothetical protein VP01_1612g7 [Puccinia sorghi]